MYLYFPAPHWNFTHGKKKKKTCNQRLRLSFRLGFWQRYVLMIFFRVEVFTRLPLFETWCGSKLIFARFTSMRIQVSRPVEQKLYPKSRRAICSLVRSLSYFFRTLVFFFFLNGNNLSLPNTSFPFGRDTGFICINRSSYELPLVPLTSPI